ncbi:MAG: hypothetical protein CR986_02425 [Ignavibacteriae bacterium]|nr:MAG: hypothetical protein CR986_02425 [Ignavibacteriota bacterium]
MNKTKLIFLLTSVAVILFVINLFVETQNNRSHIGKEKQSSKAEIKKTVDLILKDYALNKNWITKRKLKKKRDSLEYYYLVKIPSDLSTSVIVKELTKNFIDGDVELTVNEKNKSEETLVTFSSNGIAKFLLKFQYDNKLARASSQISFIIYNYNDLSLNERSVLFKFAHPFGIVLPLEKGSIENATEIKSNKKEYFIDITDNSDFMDFELSNNSDIKKLTKNSNQIISFFNSPKYFFINSKTSGFNKLIKNYIIKKFAERGRIILLSENFTYLKGENIEDLKSLLEFHLKNINPNDSKCFFIDAQDWFEVQNIITKFLKKGNKIISPNKFLIMSH